MSLKPDTVLEAGVIYGFVSNYLKYRGINVTTLDINKEVKPDVVGSVTSMPFKDSSFDIAACFQVLEHLQFEEFEKALSELSRVSRRHVIISLPDITRHIQFYIKIPKIAEIKKILELPRFKDPVHVFDGQHLWEIGKRGYSLNRILQCINKKFNVVKTYRVFEMPYHRFFVLEKLSEKYKS
ncbi:MAG: class I SAM-dependent methyltransferase [Candidatus Goldbacteria bacterium]|nr:class I SAM-dependent methyltransferase [Candidatus Goldiibacteriota bacterium]